MGCTAISITRLRERHALLECLAQHHAGSKPLQHVSMPARLHQDTTIGRTRVFALSSDASTHLPLNLWSKLCNAAMLSTHNVWIGRGIPGQPCQVQPSLPYLIGSASRQHLETHHGSCQRASRPHLKHWPASKRDRYSSRGILCSCLFALGPTTHSSTLLALPGARRSCRSLHGV